MLFLGVCLVIFFRKVWNRYYGELDSDYEKEIIETPHQDISLLKRVCWCRVSQFESSVQSLCFSSKMFKGYLGKWSHTETFQLYFSFFTGFLKANLAEHWVNLKQRWCTVYILTLFHQQITFLQYHTFFPFPLLFTHFWFCFPGLSLS